MARTNKTGRSTGGGRFLQLHHFMMASAAWRSLKPNERVIYLEIAALYDGTNNGHLALDVRTASARANINKDTVAKCLARLKERGFIELTHQARWNHEFSRAPEWRLTQYKCDRTGELPSKAFMIWRSENAESRPSVSDAPSPRFGRATPRKAAPVPSFRTGEAA